MVRVPVVDSHPYVVHVSDCLDNLKPGDHIEIQWRGSSQAPYGSILLNPQTATSQDMIFLPSLCLY